MPELNLDRVHLRRVSDPPSDPKWPDRCAIAAQLNVGPEEGEWISHVGLLVRGNRLTDWYILEAWQGQTERAKQRLLPQPGRISDIVASPPKSQGHCFWNGDYLLVWPEFEFETFQQVKKIAGALRERIKGEPYRVFADRDARFEGICFTSKGDLYGVNLAGEGRDRAALICSTFIVVLINSISGCDREQPRCPKSDYLLIADEWSAANRPIIANDVVTAACLCTEDQGASLASVNEHRIAVEQHCLIMLRHARPLG